MYNLNIKIMSKIYEKFETFSETGFNQQNNLEDGSILEDAFIHEAMNP